MQSLKVMARLALITVVPALELRARRKQHPDVRKYGAVGVAPCIGVPLPGSGVYAGAVGAHRIGFGWRKFFLANVLGVVITGVAVTASGLFGRETPSLEWILKR